MILDWELDIGTNQQSTHIQYLTVIRTPYVIISMKGVGAVKALLNGF